MKSDSAFACALALFVFTLGGSARAGEIWIQPDVNLSPPGRCCAGMAFDRLTHSTVLFGGFGNPEYFGDTWTWRDGWTKQAPATSPSARQGPGMTYDANSGTIVLFGGMTSNGVFLNDTWTWDGVNWTQQFPPVSPPARRFDLQGMTYDADTKMVILFGGIKDANYDVFGDTWTWNGTTKTWLEEFPASSPSPRRAPIAYDSASGTVVLFGGDIGNGATVFNDTWTWNGKTWTQQFPATSPFGRLDAAMAYDASLELIVLFGGQNTPVEYNDTWAWDGTNWAELQPLNVPSVRYAAAMDYDSLARGLVLFGGFGINQTLSDTWLFIPFH
jgi:hypothetical protein